MKIIIFTDMFPYGKYAEPFLAKEIEYIAKVFDEIIICPLNGSADRRQIPKNAIVLDPLFKNKKEILINGIGNLFFSIKFLSEFFENKVFTKWRLFKSFFLAVLTVRAIVSNKQIMDFVSQIDEKTVCYFYWGRGFSYAIPFIKELKNIVTRFHGYDLYEERNDGYIPFRKMQVKQIDYAIFISKQGKIYLNEKYQASLKNSYIYYLGTSDCGISNIGQDVFKIVSCSNLIDIKRVELIIKALQNIENIEIEYICIGDGPNKKSLEELALKLPKNIMIKFTGALSNNEVMDFYQQEYIDLFINVSESEGLPVSIMEAMSFGIPVVATNVGGTSEIVNSKNGFLLNKDFSVNELKDIISRYYIMDKQIKNNYINNARKHWKENFDAEINYQNFSNFLLGIIRKDS